MDGRRGGEFMQGRPGQPAAEDVIEGGTPKRHHTLGLGQARTEGRVDPRQHLPEMVQRGQSSRWAHGHILYVHVLFYETRSPAGSQGSRTAGISSMGLRPLWM